MTNKLTKSEFISILTEELADSIESNVKVTKKLAGEVYDGFINAIERVLVEENASLPLGSLGTFKLVVKDAAEFRNPSSGGTVSKPARYAVKFTASKNIKEAVEAAPIK